jgi:hypothetical protein
MDASLLIHKLHDLWEILSEKNYAARQQINRKITVMKMDPKADQDLLQMLEVLKGEYSSCITLSNMGFYRLRVLKQLHEDKEDNP